MAVEFTEIWQNLIDQWELLFRDEFTPIPVYQSDGWENVGTESIRLSDGESEQESEQSVGETRFYGAILTYYLVLKPGRDRLQQLRKAFNKINAVVNQNRASTSAATYIYHDWKILDTIINDEPEEGEPTLQSAGNVRMILQATVTEAIA